MPHEDAPTVAESAEIEGGLKRVTEALEELQAKDPELAEAINTARTAGVVSAVTRNRLTPDLSDEPKDGYRAERITDLNSAAGGQPSPLALRVKDLRVLQGESPLTDRPAVLSGPRNILRTGLLEISATDSTAATVDFVITGAGKILPVKQGEPNELRDFAIQTAEVIVEQSQIPDTLPEEYDSSAQ